MTSTWKTGVYVRAAEGEGGGSSGVFSFKFVACLWIVLF